MCNVAGIYSVYAVRDLPVGEVTGGRAVALQEVKVTEQCELHTYLSHQQWVCKNVKDVCVCSPFFPQHWQHLLGFSESTYSALFNSAESFSLSCSAMIVPGTRCDLSTCSAGVPSEPSGAENSWELSIHESNSLTKTHYY